MNIINSLDALLKAAKDRAESGDYAGAVAKLKECIPILENNRDYMALADLHLLIMDYQKLVMGDSPAQDEIALESKEKLDEIERQENREPDYAPRNQAILHPATSVKPSPATGDNAPGTQETIIDERRNPYLESWEEGERYFTEGRYTIALQKFITVKRNIHKIKDDGTILKQVDVYIKKIQDELKNTPMESIIKPLQKPVMKPINVKVEKRKRIKPSAKASQFSAFMKKAKEFRDQRNYDAALKYYQKCLEIAAEPQKEHIKKQIRRLKSLKRLKDQMESQDRERPGFSVQGDSKIVAFTGESSTTAGDQERTTYFKVDDEEKLDKIKKWQEAERLIVEAENTTDREMAIEKLQDAAHLFLITGSRRDRIEWIYNKINQLKKYKKVRPGLPLDFSLVEPQALRNYAFDKIDKAKEEAKYGHYRKTIEYYKQAIKALLKAGWTQNQVNYIIEDMIAVRKKLDKVEEEEEKLQECIDVEIRSMLDNIEAWRHDYLSTGRTDITGESIDENVHKPGREKTIIEKEYEKLRKLMYEKNQLKEEMFANLDKARHITELGRYEDALSVLYSTIEIMDKLTGWESQKETLYEEIERLKRLNENQKEILAYQQDISATNDIETQTKLEERSYLIKKAAMLDQEDLKEKLLMKKIKDEKEQMAFNFLIPVANKLKSQGKYEDALVEFKEAFKLLSEAGWTNELSALQDEINSIQNILDAKSTIETALSNEAWENKVECIESILNQANAAKQSKRFFEAKNLYQDAIDKLKEYKWYEYVDVIQREINHIDNLMESFQRDSSIASVNDDIKKRIDYHLDLGMRFLANDMKEYALAQFNKAIKLLQISGDLEMIEEIQDQVKRLKLEIKLEDSKKLLNN
ncbi:MAG: hypothetical protein ACTSRA_01890 [Promethearchaeota archaeon]